MSELAPNSGRKAGVDPKALPIAAAARMLSAIGGQRVDVEMLEADIAAGAPSVAERQAVLQLGRALTRGVSDPTACLLTPAAYSGATVRPDVFARIGASARTTRPEGRL